MPRQILEYRSTACGRSPFFPYFAGLGILAAASALTNGALLVMVARDTVGGFMDLVVVVFLGPAANVLLMILSATFSPRLRRVFRGRSIVPYFVASVLFPLGGYLIDYFLITGHFLR